ncbi:hypothetical protein Thiowin_00815 [Thiorhodovibrio winogradskyi]|uniref:SHSP domain-containing protein n=1 Tax=Thiorhodovibrio winogradskyi TaxID=77007 RepID=A0ABZ0S6N2_9GAMM|nr:hypothetical protein [Thiorhodovibrio winogradskyi]
MTTNTFPTRQPKARLLSASLLCALPFATIFGTSVAQTTPANAPSGAATFPTSQPAPVGPAYGSGYGPGHGSPYGTPYGSVNGPVHTQGMAGTAGTYPLPSSHGMVTPPNYQSNYPYSYPSGYGPGQGSPYAGPGFHGPTHARSGHAGSIDTRPGQSRAGARPMPELIQDITDEGYRLTIRLNPNQKPEDIKIVPRGRGLLISSVRESYTSSEQEDQNGRGYRRSFSFSSGRFQRHLRVPPDANPGAMTRTDKEDKVVIILPRR